MAYIGQGWPYEVKSGRTIDTFTVNNGAGPYTLSREVVGGDPVDVEVFLDNVRQQPISAYTIGGTGGSLNKQLTFTATPTASTVFYVIHEGAPGYEANTVAAGAVTNSQLATSAITGFAAEGTVADDDVILMFDTSASALKKITRANFKSVEVATTLNNVGDVTITSNSSGELIKWNGSAWINNTLAEAGIAPVASPTLTGDVTLTGAAANAVWDASDNALEFADNAKATFGAGTDLSIYHDGSHSYITDGGTGNLKITASQLDVVGTGETMATFVDDGAVTLYHNNASKIATSASGVTVTGTVAMTGGPAAGIDTTQTFTKAQRGEIVTLSSASTVTIDMATSNNFYIALGHNVTFANPSNRIKGQSGSIIIAQDGTGGRTVSWGSNWDFIGGTAPTFTTTANATDRIDYLVRENNGGIHAVHTANYS